MGIMRRLSSFLFCALTVIGSAGCGSSATSPTSTATTTNSYTLTGSLPAAVNGVPQIRSQAFLLSQGASVMLRLTSAAETMLDGTTLSTAVVGLGLGTVTNGVCTVLPGAAITASYSADVQLTWAMPQGTDCVQVSDVTTQQGPINYTITLTY